MYSWLHTAGTMPQYHAQAPTFSQFINIFKCIKSRYKLSSNAPKILLGAGYY